MCDISKKNDIDKRVDILFDNQSKSGTETFTFDIQANEALRLATEIKYENGICGSLIAMAARAIALGDYKKGQTLLNKVESDYDIDNLSSKVKMRYYGSYVVLTADSGDDYDVVLGYAKKEMEAAEALGDSRELMRIKMNVGAMSIDFNFYDTAKSFLFEAYEYYNSIDDKVMLAYCALNMAQVYTEEKAYDTAKEMLNNVVLWSEDENEITLLIHGYINLSSVMKELRDFDEATNLLGKALHKADEINHLSFKTEVIFELIGIYKAMDKYLEANQALSNIESLLGSIDDKEMVMRFYEEKAAINEGLENYESAFHALKLYNEISEKINKHNNESAMNQLIQMEYRKSLERLEAIAQAGRKLTILMDIGTVLVEVRKQLLKFMDVDAIGIGVIRDNLLHYDHYYVDGEKVEGSASSLDDTDSFGVYCVNNKAQINISNHQLQYKDYVTESSFLDLEMDDESKFNSILYAPLMIEEQVIGVFTIQSNRNNAYSSADVKIYKILTDYIAIAVRNAKSIL